MRTVGLLLLSQLGNDRTVLSPLGKCNSYFFKCLTNNTGGKTVRSLRKGRDQTRTCTTCARAFTYFIAYRHLLTPHIATLSFFLRAKSLALQLPHTHGSVVTRVIYQFANVAGAAGAVRGLRKLGILTKPGRALNFYAGIHIAP